MSEEAYNKYIIPNELIGREDNTCFVMPSYICDYLEYTCKENSCLYEQTLNFQPGYFKNQKYLVRLDIKDIKDLNIRIPTGNELGANEYWIPGGYTIGGIPEAISNLIPKYRAKIKIIYLTSIDN